MFDWVTIKTFTNQPEAEMAKAILLGVGLQSIVCSDDSGGMRPNLAFVSGVHLRVLRDDFKKASLVLDPEV